MLRIEALRYEKKVNYSTNAIVLDGVLAFCPMKCFLVEPEALEDFL